MTFSLRAGFLFAGILSVSISAGYLGAQVPPQQRSGLPVGLEMCDNACMSPDNHVLVQHWLFDGMDGRSKWNDSEQQMSTITIERFDAERVIMHRADLPGTPLAGITYVYEGTWREGRLEGTATGTWVRLASKTNPKGAFTISWYATVPVTTCDASERNAVEIGTKAIRFQQLPSAFRCFLIAAKQGNGPAKSVVGLMYRDGIGTTVNYSEAFRWLKAGAIQGDYNCQLALSQMYTIGLGTGADPAQAKLWQDQAYNNPIMMRQREQTQERQFSQTLMFQGVAAVLQAAVSPSPYRYTWP